jgi:hypothetical protein
MNFFEPLFLIPVLCCFGIIGCVAAGLINIEAGNGIWNIKIKGKDHK